MACAEDRLKQIAAGRCLPIEHFPYDVCPRNRDQLQVGVDLRSPHSPS
jgi:hypothetical protein